MLISWLSSTLVNCKLAIGVWVDCIQVSLIFVGRILILEQLYLDHLIRSISVDYILISCILASRIVVSCILILEQLYLDQMYLSWLYLDQFYLGQLYLDSGTVVSWPVVS